MICCEVLSSAELVDIMGLAKPVNAALLPVNQS